VPGILAGLDILPGFLADRGGSFWRFQFHPRTTGLGKPDRYGLLGRTRSMLTLTNVMHLFANEFSGLRGRRFALSCILFGPFQSLAFRHNVRLFELNTR
jgi:hypothetical protein